MTSRNRVDNRAHLIYDFLALHLGDGFTMPDLCAELGITDGSTTRAAIRRARDLATEAGLHFPPAIAANDFTYRVTRLAEDALDPALQMARIERGVRLRKEDGYEFIRRERRSMPAEMRPVADLLLTVHDQTKVALAAIQKAMDDYVVSIIGGRKDQRDSL